jgi:hypothetical protein
MTKKFRKKNPRISNCSIRSGVIKHCSFFFLLRRIFMYKYVYRGPVYSFGRMITDCWVGETYAVTMQKARSNLFHQCKKALGMSETAAICLPGTIREEKVEYVG